MNIYIGNLNYRVRESDLQQVLEEYGVVESVKLIIDRDTNRSKGFAFAEFTNESEARVRKLNIRIPFFIADNFLRLLQILK